MKDGSLGQEDTLPTIVSWFLVLSHPAARASHEKRKINTLKKAWNTAANIHSGVPLKPLHSWQSLSVRTSIYIIICQWQWPYHSMLGKAYQWHVHHRCGDHGHDERKSSAALRDLRCPILGWNPNCCGLCSSFSEGVCCCKGTIVCFLWRTKFWSVEIYCIKY